MNRNAGGVRFARSRRRPRVQSVEFSGGTPLGSVLGQARATERERRSADVGMGPLPEMRQAPSGPAAPPIEGLESMKLALPWLRKNGAVAPAETVNPAEVSVDREGTAVDAFGDAVEAFREGMMLPAVQDARTCFVRAQTILALYEFKHKHLDRKG